MRFEELNAQDYKHGRLARQVARRHHRERITGILVVCLGLLVLGVAIVALREPNGHVVAAQSHESTSNAANNTATKSVPPTRSSSAPHSSDSKSNTSVKDIPLIVLNNTTIPQLAEQAAQRFEAGGWTVTKYDNYQNAIASTCAYYDPSYPGAKAAAKALRLQYPTIKRVEPRFAPDPGSQPLPAGPVVVVLTPDYSAA